MLKLYFKLYILKETMSSSEKNYFDGTSRHEYDIPSLEGGIRYSIPWKAQRFPNPS
jgi:hypothetical protein